MAPRASATYGDYNVVRTVHAAEEVKDVLNVVDDVAAVTSGGTKLLTSNGLRRFAGNKAVEHFEKHGESVMKALGRTDYNLANYLDDANHVIKTGTWVPELNAYTKLIGGLGSPKAAFVGVDRAVGNITTFHVKSVQELSRSAPSLGWTP